MLSNKHNSKSEFSQSLYLCINSINLSFSYTLSVLTNFSELTLKTKGWSAIVGLECTSAYNA